jgi:MFS family permease
MLMSIPGQTVGVSVFTDFLIEALGLERSMLSMAYLVGTVASALMLSRAGRAYDRFGARITGIVVSILLGLTLVYLSYSDVISDSLIGSVGAFARTAGSAIPIIISFTVISFGFFMLRFFGQGTLTLVSRNMVMKWFERRRGIANAVLGATISLGFSLAPRFLDDLVGMTGWREAWRMLALVLLGFTVLIWIFYRDSPQIFGLEPDGGMKGPAKKSHPDTVASRDFSLKEARRTYAFWIITLTLCLSALLITAFTFHVVSIFETSGLTREDAVNIFLPSAIVAVSIQFIGSWISDYIRLKWLVSMHLFGAMLLSAGIWALGAEAPALLIIAGMGLNQGMMGITSNISWPRYFGLQHLGEVSGFAMAWTVAGSAIGPYFFSLSLDFTGTYGTISIFFFVTSILLFIGSFRVRRPE